MTTDLDQLAAKAIAQNPTELPPLNRIRQRAVQRFKRRRLIASSAVFAVVVAIGAASWSTLSVSPPTEVVVAVDRSTAESTSSLLPLPPSLTAYLNDHAAPLPPQTPTGALQAQQPPLDLDNIAAFELPEMNLSLFVATTTDRSKVCALEINESNLGISCVDVEFFERNGMAVYLQDTAAGVVGTYALLPTETRIGFIDGGTVHPSGFIVTWQNWDHQESLEIVDGAIELDNEGKSRPATTILDPAVDPLLGGEGLVWFNDSCAVLIHIYNASGRSGIASQTAETLAAAIANETDFTGEPAALNAPSSRSEAVTILIEETADCADLDRLGEAIPPADIVQRNATPADLDALGFADTGPGRIAIVLGQQYQP